MTQHQRPPPWAAALFLTLGLATAGRTAAQQPGDDGADEKPRLVDRGAYIVDTQTKLLWQKQRGS